MEITKIIVKIPQAMLIHVLSLKNSGYQRMCETKATILSGVYPQY